MIYLNVFLIGGLICAIGQLLLDLTKITSARILVVFLMAGLILQAFGIFEYIVDFAGCGATIPITGFGYTLAKGAIEGSKKGLFEALTGGITSAAMGLTAAIVFGYFSAILFKSRSKHM